MLTFLVTKSNQNVDPNEANKVVMWGITVTGVRISQFVLCAQQPITVECVKIPRDSQPCPSFISDSIAFKLAVLFHASLQLTMFCWFNNVIHKGRNDSHFDSCLQRSSARGSISGQRGKGRSASA